MVRKDGYEARKERYAKIAQTIIATPTRSKPTIEEGKPNIE